MSEVSTAVLMTLRLKGRVAAASLAGTVGRPEQAVATELESAVDAGWAVEKNGQFRLTPEGRDQVTSHVAEERAGLDANRLEDLYHRFDDYNNELKRVVSSWQVRDDGQPNDHSDQAYDDQVARDLDALHDSLTGWFAELSDTVPRLARYPEKFETAIGAVRAGELTFIAKPIADSYHTVWFELHEELIQLLGRDRATEAAAGRAV